MFFPAVMEEKERSQQENMRKEQKRD